jgi:toxin ParE1/3/4
MAYSVAILELAAADVLKAKKRFNELRPSLGNDFALSIQEAIARIQHSPMSYAKMDHEFRRVFVRRFPYAIYFRADDRQIIVYGVFPQSAEQERPATAQP